MAQLTLSGVSSYYMNRHLGTMERNLTRESGVTLPTPA